MSSFPAASPTGLTRRSLLARTATTGIGLALTGSLDTLFGAAPASAQGGVAAGAGYGPLVPDPAGLLSLPPGFSYTVVSYDGTDTLRPGVPATVLDTGEPSPGDPDGAAVFPLPDGGHVLVLNHELGLTDPGPQVPVLPRLTYDPVLRGGTTNIILDKHGRRLSEHVSLAGTEDNCAGGPTPWGTWLTCEETEDRSGVGGRTQDHGYVFEVDPYDPERNLDPVPIKALGRFPHEAVAVDPSTGHVYETEDANRPHGLVYRWTPPTQALPLGRGSLRGLDPAAGVLEALRASAGGTPVPDLSVATEPGTTYDLSWVPVPERDAPTKPVRSQVVATRSRKLEGMWWGDGGVYVVSSFARTRDGSARQHDGQVWFLDPARQTLQLRLLFAVTPESDDPDGPDTITVSPYGGVMIAEDSAGVQHLVGATPSGEAFLFGRSEHPGLSEFAGPTFSPDRQLLFVSIMSPGYVFAIRGPFRAHR